MQGNKRPRWSPVEIRVEDLVPNPHPIRSSIELPSEFIKDIGSGVRQPLHVRPLKGKQEGRYEIVTGMRRYEAAIKAGLRTLPCIVREDLDEVGARLEAVRENYHRQSVEPADLAEYLKWCQSKLKLTERRISRRLNMKASEVRKWLRLSEEQELLSRLRRERLLLGHALEILDAEHELAELVKRHRIEQEVAQRLRIDIINAATKSTVPQLKRFIAQTLSEYRSERPKQTSIFETAAGQSPHDRAVERLHAELGGGGAKVLESFFRPDLVAKLSSNQVKEYGTRCLWVEVVDTNPPSHSKINELIDILGPEWGILVYDFIQKRKTMYPKA